MAETQKRLPGGIVLEKEINFAGPYFFFAYVSNRGEVLAAESFWEDTGHSTHPENSIGLITCIGLIFRGLLFIPRYYSQFDYKKNVKYAFIVDKPLGRRLVMDSEQGRFLVGDYIAKTDEPIIIEQTILSDLKPEDAKKITIEMVKKLLWYFNYDNTNDNTLTSLVDEVKSQIVL